MNGHEASDAAIRFVVRPHRGLPMTPAVPARPAVQGAAAPDGEVDAAMWPLVSRPTLPASGTVSVLAFGLDHPHAVIRRMEEILSPDELERAGRFVYQGLRHRYIAGRAGLRLALGAVLDRPAASLRFDYGARGKPVLLEGAPALRFNLSHSEARALLAVTLDAEVGVDIEAVSTDVELDDMANRFFSPRERVEYRRFPDAERSRAFFRCWTRKEAIIKAVGDGLSLPLDRFDVSIGDDSPRVLRFLDRFRPDDWSLFHLEPGPGFAGAVAVRANGFHVQSARWDVVASLHAT
jgi:4'-phosphopantetheinyl transferase